MKEKDKARRARNLLTLSFLSFAGKIQTFLIRFICIPAASPYVLQTGHRT